MTEMHDQLHDPAHPGEIVREECLARLGLTVTAQAALGVTRKALSDLSNGHTGVSPEMAIRSCATGAAADHRHELSASSSQLLFQLPSYNLTAIKEI